MSAEAKVAECLCPDPTTHPEGETIAFKPTLGFRELATARWAVANAIGQDSNEVLATLSELYLLHFIEKWTLKNGKPIPVTRENVEKYLLSKPQAAIEVADVADALYSPVVVLPLVERALRSSPTSQTSASTSAKPGKNRKPQKQSSTSTTQTAGTAQTPE